MFYFQHPRPFSRKEVAVLVTQAKAQPGGPSELLCIDSDQAKPVVPTSLVPGASGDSPPLRFTFSYRLREYLSILVDHVCDHLRSTAKRPSIWTSRPMVRATVAVLGPPLFFFKRRAMPVVTFSFDVDGVERASAAGVQRYAWSDIQAVKRYAKGYLLVLAGQGMPIPHRCLTASQAGALRFLFVRNKLA